MHNSAEEYRKLFHAKNKEILVLLTCICIGRSVNIIFTRITRVNNEFFCYVAISDDISGHAKFQVAGYLSC